MIVVHILRNFENGVSMRNGSFLAAQQEEIPVFTTESEDAMNARNYFYDYILQFVDLSPFFMGLGRGTVTDLMALNYGYLYVHSDIIKMFAEIGMLGFIIWSSYYFIWLTKLFCRKYGNEGEVFCFMVMLYTSVLFLTDNTENYYICQLVRTTLPMAYAVSKSSNTLRCKKMSDLEKRVIK